MPKLIYKGKVYPISQETKELILLLDGWGMPNASIAVAIGIRKGRLLSKEVPQVPEIIKALDIARTEKWPIHKISKALSIPGAGLIEWLLWRKETMTRISESDASKEEKVAGLLHLQGFRPSELAEMKWQDIDLEHGLVRSPSRLHPGRPDADMGIEG